MGVFKKTKSSIASSSHLTIVAEGCTLKGELHVIGDILVAGQVEGKITCQNSTSIGISGVIRGSVWTRELVVSGLVAGDVCAETVEILVGGRVQGNIQTEQLIIERGGFFSGASEAVTTQKDRSGSSELEARQPALIEH